MGTVLQEIVELGHEGSSPLVPISEVVKRDAKVVPEIYIRSIEERPKSSDLVFPSHDVTIPIIDFTLLSKGDEDELRKLDAACQGWGIFQIINHGQDSSLTQMRKVSTEFFDLPLSEKNKYTRAKDDDEGYGEEFFYLEEDKKDWSDLFVLVSLPTQYRNMKYWPVDIISGFKEVVEDYATQIQTMADEILMKLSVLMGVEKGYLKRLHGDMKQFVRMNHYPACANPDLVLGMTSHSDNNSITLIVQDDDITALQVKYNNDTWIPVKPIPNAVVVVIGDSLEAWSNGKYKSNEHRVVTNAEKQRVSIAAFMFPGDNVELNPLKTMIDDDDHPRIYRDGVNYKEYVSYTLSLKSKGKEDYIGYIKMKN